MKKHLNINDLDTGTWRRKSGLASWTFRLPPRADESSEAALKRWTIALVSTLDGFAQPRTAEWTTISEGEDALIQTEVEPKLLEEAFAAHPDATQVLFPLDLLCVTPTGEEAPLVEGATMWTECSWPDPNKPGEGVAKLFLFFDLDVDIYAPRSWGKTRDNRQLAALNGPRLARFLRSVREIGAELVEVDGEDYPGQAGADGFHLDDQ